MCYSSDAQPPELPTAGGNAHGEDIVLTAADSNRFSAYIARPEHPTGAQVLILPDIRGLHQFYKELALRFAEAGITALGLDYFGRTAGLTTRDDSFEFMPHVQQLQLPTFFADVKAATDKLHSETGADAKSAIFSVGFCLGGSFSIEAATQDFGLAGAIAFYAGLSRAFTGANGETVLQQASKVKSPVLGLFGGADQNIPVSDVQKLDENLDSTGVEHTIVIYEGAPHSFFDRKAVEFAEASTDAWNRILNFIADHK